MASDVEDLNTFYTDLPSIFENNSTLPSSSSHTHNSTLIDEKSYQPIFGSFLYADSDPLSQPAFVVPPSSEHKEQIMEDYPLSEENHLLSSIQTTPLSPLPLSNIDDIDEDDFDGIPIRHASMTMEKKINGETNFNSHQHDEQFNQLIQRIENSLQEDHEMEDDNFLNGFSVDQRQETTTREIPMRSSLFNDIPDIDDPNPPEDDDDEKIPFDHMDMSDQSDSIRSSSPDSLLSSSHLQDEQDDIDGDDDVEQWNDDHLLETTTTTTTTTSKITPLTNGEYSFLNLPNHPFDQVDFIDSSRSHSRCSNASSHLSVGYADQARQFLTDDELMSSSDSDNNDDDDDGDNNMNPNDNVNYMHGDTKNEEKDNDDDICLQVDLDDHQSISSFSESDSIRSTESIPDETPIIDIDEDLVESKGQQIAPIAVLDDEDNETSQTTLLNMHSNIENLQELKRTQHRNELVHEIIQMQHLFDENDNDDEFLAIMHNPKIFEEILYNDLFKKSELVKQTNSMPGTCRQSAQLSKNNEIRSESLEHCQNIHQTSSLFQTKNEKTIDSFLLSRKTMLTAENSSSPSSSSSSPPDVNHLKDEDQENNALMNVASTTDILQEKQSKQLSLHSPNISLIGVKQVISTKEHSSMMDSDTDSTDDTELFKTLSQIHGITNPSLMSFDGINQVEYFSSSSTPTPDTNEEKKSSSDLNKNNEMELSNGNTQVRRPIIFSSPFVINTIKQSDEEKQEKNEKNIIFHKNHNDVDVNDKQKKKYERREEEEEDQKNAVEGEKEKEATASILFTNDSHSPVVCSDSNTSYSLPHSPLLPLHTSNRSIEITNQLNNDDWQISLSSKINMTHRSDDQQITTNLFDPFAPTTTTTTTTTTTMNIFGENEDSPIHSHATQPLANYNFDDLWNQSMSDMDSMNKHNNTNPIDPTAFTWDSLINNDTMGKTNLTWESLFSEKEEEKDEDEKTDLKEFLHWLFNHFNDLEPDITFTSTQNLESIVKDIQMSTLPFEPIPSPPLHVDHSVSNPLINAIHHDLFPIDELEQPIINQGPQSMILYEENEEEEEEEEEKDEQNQLLTFDEQVKPIVEQLVSDTLQLALTELNNKSYDPVEHFVDQILTQAIYEVYEEEQSQAENETITPIPTENLASIISWHDQAQATKKQIPDPFDQKFDSVWSRHFQAPDDLTNENLFENETKESIDPWLNTSSNSNIDPMVAFSQTFDDMDLFSSSSNPLNKTDESDNDQSAILSEYLPPLLLTNPASTTTATNDLMKYTLTAPVLDDSGDDSSPIEEYLMSRKNDTFMKTSEKIDEQPIKVQQIPTEENKEMKINEEENIFSNNARSSQFQAFASDQPLHNAELQSKLTDMNVQFDEELNESSPWTSIVKPTETIKFTGNVSDEPWELEDHREEKTITSVVTSTQLTSPFNDSQDQNNDSKNNYFFDSFNPTKEIEYACIKTVRFDDNIQNIHAPPPPPESLSTMDTTEVDINGIIPQFETKNNQMETSYVQINKTDLTVPDRPYESIESTQKIENTDAAKLSNSKNLLF